jgi:hypothetical protein
MFLLIFRHITYNILFVEKDCDSNAHEDRDKRRGKTGNGALTHANGKEQAKGEDDGDGHAQRGDNASLIRPRFHSRRLLRNHGTGDAEITDIAGNKSHICPGDADDQEIGNGLHKSNHSNGTRDGQKAAENGRSRRHESEDGRVPARERNRGATPPRW